MKLVASPPPPLILTGWASPISPTTHTFSNAARSPGPTSHHGAPGHIQSNGSFYRVRSPGAPGVVPPTMSFGGIRGTSVTVPPAGAARGAVPAGGSFTVPMHGGSLSVQPAGATAETGKDSVTKPGKDASTPDAAVKQAVDRVQEQRSIQRQPSSPSRQASSPKRLATPIQRQTSPSGQRSPAPPGRLQFEEIRKEEPPRQPLDSRQVPRRSVVAEPPPSASSAQSSHSPHVPYPRLLSRQEMAATLMYPKNPGISFRQSLPSQLPPDAPKLQHHRPESPDAARVQHHRHASDGGTTSSSSDAGSDLQNCPPILFRPCSGHNAVFVPTGPDNKALLEVIESCLINGPRLQGIVRQCFKEAASGNGLDANEVVEFRSRLSKALGVPEAVFPGVKRQHLRFDLEGSGKLDAQTVFILVYMNLWEHRKLIAEYSSGVSIPAKALADVGYTIVKELGHGNQSRANLAKDQNGLSCCIKTYKKIQMRSLDLECLKLEYEVLQHLGKHENIARVSDIFQDRDYFYMVSELYQGGDFTTLRQRAKDTNVAINESWWRGIFRQCFQGLLHIHEHAVFHGDVKESNLMLKKDQYGQPEVVIIDFGLIQTFVSDASVIWGTPGYIAPETWECGKTFPQGDIFAMGVVIMQMLLNKIPPHHDPPPGAEVLPDGIFTEGLRTMQEVGIFTRARTPPFDKLSEDFPLLPLLVRRLLEKDVRRRLGARKVLQDGWFTSVGASINDGFNDLMFRWFG